jgi:hypothetical protein
MRVIWEILVPIFGAPGREDLLRGENSRNALPTQAIR